MLHQKYQYVNDDARHTRCVGIGQLTLLLVSEVSGELCRCAGAGKAGDACC